MSLITNAALTTLLDKAARFGAMGVGDAAFNASFTAGLEAAAAAVLSGSNSIETFLLSTADADVIADILPAARDLDEVHPSAPQRFLFGLASVGALFTGINNHVKRYGNAATLNVYLSALNASAPTLRAHAALSDHLIQLSPQNVFIGADLDLSSITVTGASAGTFLKLTAIDKAKYGGAKLVAKNVGVLGSTTAISVVGKKFDGTSATLTASIATLTSGAETNLSSVVREFVEVTGITVTGATAGNVIKIVAKTDRDISAA